MKRVILIFLILLSGCFSNPSAPAYETKEIKVVISDNRGVYDLQRSDFSALSLSMDWSGSKVYVHMPCRVNTVNGELYFQYSYTMQGLIEIWHDGKLADSTQIDFMITILR